MRSKLCEVGAAMQLLGIAIVAAALLAIARESVETIRRVLPAEASSAPEGFARWLRACAFSSECRRGVSWVFRRTLRTHASFLSVTSLVGVGLEVLGRMWRARAAGLRSSAGCARYASLVEIWRLACQSGEAWLPLGYAPFPRFLRAWARRSARTGIRHLLSGPLVRLPTEDLARHVLTVGLTGSHKTTAVVLPIVLEAARHGVSVVALDLKYGEGDSLVGAAQEWQRWARDVLVFAPLDTATLRWNPLVGCRSIGDGQRIASQLFDDLESSDPGMVYWMGAERHVCAALCHAVTVDGGPPTLGRVRSLCESGPGVIHAFVGAHPHAAQLMARLGAYLAMLPKDQAGILQGIAARLEAWGDDAVCAATGQGAPWEHVDLGRLRREPVLLIVGVPQAALGRLRWLCRLFLRDLAVHLLRPRDADEAVRVLLVLEELPAWGALPGLADHLATYRSRQVSVVATLQSTAQGEHVYGRAGWAAIEANLVTKLYLPSLADGDAERLSQVLGMAPGEDVAHSRGWGAAGYRGGEQRRAIPVPLGRAEELRGGALETDEVLVRFGRMPPARLWCPPFYLRPPYVGRSPDRLPRTPDLAVYHHLWIRRANGSAAPSPPPAPETPTAPPRSPAVGGHPQGSDPPAPPSKDAPTPADISSPAVGGHPQGSDPPAPPSEDAPTPADISELHRFLEVLIHAQRDRPDALRGVRVRGRLIEVRVDPRAVSRACGRPEVMHALARRWSALRWVRRVRPSFVLSRRALDALDSRLARRLESSIGDGGAKP
ncbi:MAG TPA: type IV secretory system conjugative DNA transfer family protein [bacterium]|nr:type IV secretory system conjugative DNA transfer family protein [bacterium]